MLYVDRNQKGEIIAVRRKLPDENGGEMLPLLNGEMLAFLGTSGEINSLAQLLALTDDSIIRVLEDLIDLLIKKNVILFTELPEQAQEKIRERKEVRLKIGTDAFMADDEDIL